MNRIRSILGIFREAENLLLYKLQFLLSTKIIMVSDYNFELLEIS